MDATSSSLPFNTRDGSISAAAAAAAAEDDTALSLAAGLAKEAALLFQAGKFVECWRVLNQLLQKKDDPKVSIFKCNPLPPISNFGNLCS